MIDNRINGGSRYSHRRGYVRHRKREINRKSRDKLCSWYRCDGGRWLLNLRGCTLDWSNAGSLTEPVQSLEPVQSPSVLLGSYSMPSKSAIDVTVGEPDVGTEAGLAPIVVVVSSMSCRYSDSAKSLPLAIADRRRT